LFSFIGKQVWHYFFLEKKKEQDGEVELQLTSPEVAA